MAVARGPVSSLLARYGTDTGSGQGTANTMTWSTNPSAGSKILVFWTGYYDGGSPTEADELPSSVTDNQGNTFVRDVLGYESSSNTPAAIYRADLTAAPSGTYTVTCAYGGTMAAVAAGAAYTGLASGAPASGGTSTGSGSGTSASTGAATVPSGGGVAVATAASDAYASSTPVTIKSSGWSSVASESDSLDYAAFNCSDILVSSGTSSETATWTATGADYWAAAIAVYGPAPAAVTASGTLAMQAPGLSGEAATAAVPVTASGGLALQPPGMSASATVANPVTASGTLALPPAGLSGSGKVLTPVSASGTLALPAAGIAGAGTVANPVTATGSLAARPAGISGRATVANPVSASGTLAMQPLGLSGMAAGETPHVVNTWTGSYTFPGGDYFPYPAATAVSVQPARANAAGNWLIAVCAWRQHAAGDGVSVSVADDAHNWWEPLGSDSSADGTVRTAVWAAPAARATGYIAVSPTGSYQSLAITVIELAGAGPGWTPVAGASGFAQAAESLALSAAAPAAQAVMIAAWAADSSAATLTPPSGWTVLPGASVVNGTDATGDLELGCGWQLADAATAADIASSASADLAGVIAGFLTAGETPPQPNPAWPALVTEIAIGSGPQSRPSEMAWTEISARDLAVSMQQGRQYTLSQLQAGQGTLTLDNPDGALIPPGSGDYAGLDSGNPFRQRCYWPGLPGQEPSLTPWYIPVAGYLQRWPFNVQESLLRGQTQAVIADAFAYASGTLNSMAKEECLIDEPYALWPLDDADGSSGASNLAPGNSAPLIPTTLKRGAGGATSTWGANSGTLLGDSSAQVTASGQSGGASGTWQQQLSGASSNSAGYGYALTCSDDGYPSITGGLTLECFFDCAAYYDDEEVIYGFSTAAGASQFGVTGDATFAAGTPVVLSTASGYTFPGGYTAGRIYYTVGTGSTFGLASSPGGAAGTATAGAGYLTALAAAQDMIIVSLWNVRDTPVVALLVAAATGYLQLRYTTGTGTSTTVTLDPNDWRNTALDLISLSFDTETWRVWVPGLAGPWTGTFSAPLAGRFSQLCAGGAVTSRVQGNVLPGSLAFVGIYPGISPPIRVLARQYSALTGCQLEEAANRAERILEYAGLTGRRLIQFQQVAGEGDLVVSGQDIGGQAAASSLNNIAASTVPGILYVAPNGDIVREDKWFTWNGDVDWQLGDDADNGEIPFTLQQFATDYDPARVVNDIQLTQLDSQTVTVPDGVTATTTMATVEAASRRQYGDQVLQQTGYLYLDFSDDYDRGSSMGDLADWIANVYSRPANRIQQVQVDAASHPAAWPFYLGASVGDMVTVNVRLPTMARSPAVSMTARITQTSRTGQFGQNGTSATIACVLDFAPEYRALTCDDPVRGLLNGQNCLPWLRATAE